MTIRSTSMAALLAAALPLATAQAGGHGCDSRAAECHEKIMAPEVSTTAHRPVGLVSERADIVHAPAITTARIQHVETSRGRWVTESLPTRYTTIARSVIVKPARATYTVMPPQYRTVRETVIVTPASVRWERQVDRHGRETMCKIAVPAVTREIERTVQITPATRVAHITPAVYKTVHKTVLAAPAAVRKHYSSPSYTRGHSTVVINTGGHQAFLRPISIGTVAHSVPVQKATAQWRPAHRGWR